MKDSWLTVKDTAQILKVSERTVRRYLADGMLVYVKPRGRVLVSVRSLGRFIGA
jgi:excisionase family DNA binding protein